MKTLPEMYLWTRHSLSYFGKKWKFCIHSLTPSKNHTCQ